MFLKKGKHDWFENNISLIFKKIFKPLTCGVVGPPLFWKLIKEDDEPGEDDVATKINIQLMKCCNCSKKFICWNNIKNVFEEEVATIIKMYLMKRLHVK